MLNEGGMLGTIVVAVVSLAGKDGPFTFQEVVGCQVSFNSEKMHGRMDHSS